MKLKYIFFFVSLFYIFLLFANENLIIDFGTDYAGVLETNSDYSNSSIQITRGFTILALIFAFIVSIIYGWHKFCQNFSQKGNSIYKEHEHNFEEVGKHRFGWLELLLYIVIIFILAGMALPNFKRGCRPISNQKACYSNMRVINSAVEMYNMDVKEGENMMDDLDLSKLVSSSYLKRAPICPETCESKSYTGNNLKTTGQIHCLYENKEYPDLDHGYIDK